MQAAATYKRCYSSNYSYCSAHVFGGGKGALLACARTLAEVGDGVELVAVGGPGASLKCVRTLAEVGDGVELVAGRGQEN